MQCIVHLRCTCCTRGWELSKSCSIIELDNFRLALLQLLFLHFLCLSVNRVVCGRGSLRLRYAQQRISHTLAYAARQFIHKPIPNDAFVLSLLHTRRERQGGGDLPCSLSLALRFSFRDGVRLCRRWGDLNTSAHNRPSSFEYPRMSMFGGIIIRGWPPLELLQSRGSKQDFVHHLFSHWMVTLCVACVC